MKQVRKCWKGYKKAGTQKLFGKTYNRCVKAHFSDWRADMELQEAIPGYDKYNDAVAANALFVGSTSELSKLLKQGFLNNTEDTTK